LAIGYRAILRLEQNQDAVKMAEDQLRSWLRDKDRKSRYPERFANWEGQGLHNFGKDTSLTVVSLQDDRDGSTRQLWRFREKNPGGSWQL
jgi:hypothetical protein